MGRPAFSDSYWSCSSCWPSWGIRRSERQGDGPSRRRLSPFPSMPRQAPAGERREETGKKDQHESNLEGVGGHVIRRCAAARESDGGRSPPPLRPHARSSCGRRRARHRTAVSRASADRAATTNPAMATSVPRNGPTRTKTRIVEGQQRTVEPRPGGLFPVTWPFSGARLTPSNAHQRPSIRCDRRIGRPLRPGPLRSSHGAGGLFASRDSIYCQ